MDWTILGIAPTDDKKAITAAYRARLKTTNPEEKPEQFKALRTAYEEALRLADQKTDAPIRDESPVGLWMERVAALYNDYPARINAENWRKLLCDDVCAALDTRPLAEGALIRFLMASSSIPRRVWLELDAAFSWLDRAEELKETYPADFVEYRMVSSIRYDQILSYDLFEPGLDGKACDAYRELYYQIYNAEPDDRAELLDRLEAMPEQHPYGRALRCFWLLDQGREEEGRAGFRALAQAYPQEEMLCLDHANLCLRYGEIEEAETQVKRILSENPDQLNAKRILAQCMAARGELAEAKETLYDVMHASGDDPIAMNTLMDLARTWNAELIERYETFLAENPDDAKSAVELAWCHIQCERPDAAMDVALTIDESKADPFDYHNLMGKLYYNIQMFPETAEHLEKLVTLVRALKPDGTDKTAKRISRLPELLQILGNSLLQTGQQDRAQAVFAEALAIAPDDPKVLTMMANIHRESGDYDACLEVLHHLTHVSPGSWFGHLMTAMCCYKLRRDAEAFEAVNRAMAIQSGDLTLYILKMQILLRNGVFDEVHSILDFLKEAGAPEDAHTDFIRAQLLEHEKEDMDAVFRAYQAIARRVEEGEEFFDGALLYFRMANLMGQRNGHRTQQDRNDVLALVEKGLAQDPNDADCLDYKAWLLQRSGRLTDAIAMFKDMNTPTARRKLADLYFEDLRTYGAEALAIYEDILRERQTPEIAFYAACCARNVGDLEKSEHYSRLAIDLDPGDIDAHRNLALLREKEGRYDEALEHMELALTSMWDNGLFYGWLLEHKLKVLRRLGRHAEALAVIDDAMSRSDYDGWQTKFDICCQFGLFDQAEAVLAQWGRAQQGNPDVTKAAGQLHLYRRKMLKATFSYGKVKHQMDRFEQMALRAQLAELEANTKRSIQLLTQQLADTDSCHDLMMLAFHLRRTGERKRSAELAAEALKRLDADLTGYRTDELILRTGRSLVLMLLGREGEARAELELCRSRPLCEKCAYGRCKDADIFEAYIEELAGNRKLALELHRAGQKNWPDELDFVSGENYLKKKKGT